MVESIRLFGNDGDIELHDRDGLLIEAYQQGNPAVVEITLSPDQAESLVLWLVGFLRGRTSPS